MSVAAVDESKTLVEPHFWMDPEPEREPYRKIIWYAHGSTDVNGEWHYVGQDYADIRRGLIGNLYEYRAEMRQVKSRTGRSVTSYEVTVSLTDDFFRCRVGTIKAKTKRKTRQAVVGIIQEFEASDRFAVEVWPRVVALENRKPIVKQMTDGTYQWIATTIAYSPFHVIDHHGKYSEWGYGQYWYQYHDRRWANEPLTTKWGSVETKGYATTGGGGEVPLEVVQALTVL